MSDGKGKTILFQGDSITDGSWRRDGNDPNAALGHSYAYLIAAQLGCEYPESSHRFINRGVGGNRVSDLYARWNEDAFHLKPDLISILIGVNDAWRIMAGEPSGATDRFERSFRHLLEETREVLPEAGLVLCEPFILKGGATEENWGEWRTRIDGYGAIARQLAREFQALFVPLQEPFNRAAERTKASDWIFDGVHPTAAGNRLIANAWLEVVQRSNRAIG